MPSSNYRTSDPVVLGIEGGATRTIAIQGNEKQFEEREFGPANLRLLTDSKLTRLFRSIHDRFHAAPAAVAIGLAGARTAGDRLRMQKAAARIWANVPVQATNDLETALLAAGGERRVQIPGSRNRHRKTNQELHVLILSGTGSCCFGRTLAGRTAKVGGWGHLLGDKGSGYEIGLRALKATLHSFDLTGKWPRLGSSILGHLQLSEPDDLISWAQSGTKSEIAELATEVFEAWHRGDPIATDILSAAAHSLVEDASSCVRRLSVTKQVRTLKFIFAGSVLLKQPRFALLVRRMLQKRWRACLVVPLQRSGAWGAWRLARELASAPGNAFRDAPVKAFPAETTDFWQDSPTERRNPRSLHLDRMPTIEAVELMLSEDEKVPAAIRREKEKIARVVKWIASAFHKGGRLFYVGAGTSGRLGILDASECPPTFRSDPEMVQGIIAGGATAIWRAVEGAEDDRAAGRNAICYRAIRSTDVVIGITASGRTPFVWGALQEAMDRKAKTVLVCFNPALAVPPKERPNLIICPAIGPEVLTGSTRLKAGTATKLILNIFSTLAMVGIGKVTSNLMVDLNPSNSKLRARAIRIVSLIAGVPSEAARAALEKKRWSVGGALKHLGWSARSPHQSR